MRVLLINPAVEHYYKSVTGPLGVLAIASYLKKGGHEVTFVDRCVKKTDIEKLIVDNNPQIIGVALMSAKVIVDVREIYNTAKKHGIPVIAGGATASVVPKLVIDGGCADAVIKGEGEITWAEAVKAVEEGRDFSDVDGMCFVKDGVFTENPDRDFADLSQFPPIDWEMTGDPSVYFQSLFGQKKVLYIYTAKGCPGQCTFCFNERYQKRCYRKRPLETALEEVKLLTEKYGRDGVHFSDEIWCRTREEMYENCRMIKESGLIFEWGCNFRIGQIKPEDFSNMYDAGCRWIFFGIESGSDHVQKMMKKGIRLDKVYETVRACHDAGITAISSFIVGFPGEREEDLKKTVELIQTIPFSMFDCNFFFPFEGTQMHDVLVSEGRYKEAKKIDDLRVLEKSEYKLVNSINFTEVPTRDIKVVRSWILWQSFTRKIDKNDGKKELFAFKAAIDAIRSLFGGGIKHFFLSFGYSAQMILNVMFNVFCFPSVRKKYGIRLSARKRK